MRMKLRPGSEKAAMGFLGLTAILVCAVASASVVEIVLADRSSRYVEVVSSNLQTRPTEQLSDAPLGGPTQPVACNMGDGLIWPHCDGLIWRYPAQSSTEDHVLFENLSGGGRQWLPEWSNPTR